MAVNNTMENLLSQYTNLIKPDNRVFSTDVMSYDQFASPFKKWIGEAANQYLLPDFLRYQYNPYMQQSGKELGNLNQNIGLSGAWRTAQGGQDLNDAAQQAILGQEQLQSGYNNQLMDVQDQFLKQWVDPLYQSRLTSYYNAPFRNLDLGGEVLPIENPTNPNISMPQQPALSQQYGFNPSVFKGVSNTGMTGTNGLPYAADMGGNQRNLLSQYLKVPTTPRTDPLQILGQ